MAAADDDNLGGRGEGGEGLGGNGGCEGTEVLLTILWMFVSIFHGQEGVNWVPYPTEEMPYEYYQNPARSILIVGIQALERRLLPILV